MTNILLVFTGGTIGSIAINGTVNTDKNQNYQLLNLFKQQHPTTEVTFKTRQPFQLLSENCFPSIWEALIKDIESENLSDYDGIIITHGTDTLAFTASALGIYFNSIKIPLLLVSSDYPLNNDQANGISNFNCAIEYIKQRKSAGVFVPYKNQNSEALVHIGTRLSSCLQLSGDFVSVQSKAYLQFKDQNFQQLSVLDITPQQETKLLPDFSSNILLIKPYPGLDYSIFLLDQVEAVLHDLYHSGTACATKNWGDNYSLTSFIQKCTKLNIPVYMAPAVNTTDNYDSTKVLIEQGAHVIWNTSLESVYIKLLLAYKNFKNEALIHQFLNSNIAHEHVSSYPADPV